jgi:SAM-dependent methyltransferase
MAPQLQYSQNIYEDVLKQYANPRSAWLDLGCGHSLLSHWRFEEEEKIVNVPEILVGFDYDLQSLKNHQTIQLKVKGDISHLPFKAGSFDLVTANMVFEHLMLPETQMLEINKSLKPDGVLIFHTPNVWGYSTIFARLIPEKIKSAIIYFLQDRKEEDVFPTYYRINSIFRIERCAKSAGFMPEKLKLICTAPQFIVIPFLVVFELLWIRLLMTQSFRKLRTNIIAILRKA